MTNLFKDGFTNVDGERTADLLPVEGEVPEWLRGKFITNGPAIFDLHGYTFKHWFDGLAMLNGFFFSDRGVGYLSRFVRSEDFSDYVRLGVVEASTFATKGHRKGLERLRPSGGHGGDNANVNLAQIGDRYYAMDESTPMMEFEPQTLETTGKRRDRSPIDGQVTTAHPISDGSTGEMVNYLLHFGARTSYKVFAFGSDAGDVREIASIPVKEPSYMHSFAMTRKHVVLIQNPLVVNPLSFIASPRPFIEHYEWRPELGTRFTVMSRGEGPTTTKEAVPFFCYHHVNSFEKSGAIQCDVLTYPDATIVNALMLDNLRSDRPENIRVGELKRYSIPTEEGSEVTSRSMSSEGLEFPRIDPRRTLEEHRFIYGTGQTSKDGTDFLDQLVKVDAMDGTVKRWRSEGCYPGEAVFVPRPGGHQEDDGAVMSIVLDPGRKASFLLLLDGGSFKELARVDAPQLIPFKFHGNFYMS